MLINTKSKENSYAGAWRAGSASRVAPQWRSLSVGVDGTYQIYQGLIGDVDKSECGPVQILDEYDQAGNDGSDKIDRDTNASPLRPFA